MMMKKMNKIIAFAVICILAMAMFAGCNKKSDEKPEIVGASDFDCIINEPIDLLQRVSAFDKEDGDITPAMKISITPEVAVNDGVVIFPKEDDYDVTYTVTDSSGKTATEEVVISAYARDVYKAFELVDMGGFSVDVKGGAKLESQSVKGDGGDSKLAFKVSGAQNADDAALTRTYSLTTGSTYSFAYTVNSKTAGNVKTRIGETVETHAVTAETDTVISFTHSVPADEDNEKADVKVELLCGELGNDIELTFVKAVTENDEYVAHAISVGGTREVTFDKIEERIDTEHGGDSLAGTVSMSSDKTSATLDITGAGTEMWPGGMFIRTGYGITADRQYVVEFDVTAVTDDEFAVKAFSKQWGPDDQIQYGEKWFNKGSAEANSGHAEITFVADAAKANIDGADGLWLYVMSGKFVNTITVSNVVVTEKCAYERIDGSVQGSVSVDWEKNEATLSITATGDDWQGGMFIDTGRRVQAGKDYTVEFDVKAETGNNFAVIAQNRRWAGVEERYHFESFNAGSKEDNSRHVKATFTAAANIANAAEADGLWLYVQSGDALNSITLSNITVTCEEHIVKSYGCTNTYKMWAYAGAPCYTEWVDGKLVYKVEHFGDTDWHNKIEGPNFDIGTAKFGDYIVSFKAKATAPVQITVIGPVSDGWDPNVVWARFNLTDTETTYTIRGNAMDFPATHHFEWQFGTALNQGYENVTIEISELTIYFKSFVE